MPASAMGTPLDIEHDQYSSTSTLSGLSIRCAACYEINDTANGDRCTHCGSPLTTYSESFPSASHLSMLAAPVGSFTMDKYRVAIHDGYLDVHMHTAQRLQDVAYTEYTVYALRCQWQPQDAACAPTTWLVSHRFRVFEQLHRDLERRIPSTLATLPRLPRKYFLRGVVGGKTGTLAAVVDARKQELGNYIVRVLEICAQLANTLAVPELDRFLNVTQQVERVRRGLADSHSRVPSAVPLGESELTQMEQAVALLNQAIRSVRGDLRRDTAVQYHLCVCAQRAAQLSRMSTTADLMPRVMQCRDTLETTMALYNDSLMAVHQTYVLSAEECGGGNLHVPPSYVPGQENSYRRS